MQTVSQLSAWTVDDPYTLPPALAEIRDPPGAPGVPVLPGLGDGSGWDGLFSHAGHQPLWTECVHTEMGGPVLLTPDLTHRRPPGKPTSPLLLGGGLRERSGDSWSNREQTHVRAHAAEPSRGLFTAQEESRWRALKNRQDCSHLLTWTKCTLTLHHTGLLKVSSLLDRYSRLGKLKRTFFTVEDTVAQRYTRRTSRLLLLLLPPPLAAGLFVLKVFLMKSVSLVLLSLSPLCHFKCEILRPDANANANDQWTFRQSSLGTFPPENWWLDASFPFPSSSSHWVRRPTTSVWHADTQTETNRLVSSADGVIGRVYFWPNKLLLPWW